MKPLKISIEGYNVRPLSNPHWKSRAMFMSCLVAVAALAGIAFSAIPAVAQTKETTLAQSSSLSGSTAPQITAEQAKKIAAEALPGEVIDVGIEKKLGAKRYVVEVISASNGAETDVIIDMETGEVLAIDE